MIKDLPQEFLDNEFAYPEEYLKVIELNLCDFEYWYMFSEENALKRLNGLKKRYPERQLIPFARRDDSDDIACFEVGDSIKVQLIHDFASSGFEQKRTYRDFWEWFLEAVNELVQNFESDL